MFLGLAVFFAATAIVFLARWLMTLDGVRALLDTYPGTVELPATAPHGLPAWIGWQHFFNAFLMVLIIRTGWRVRTEKRPSIYWTAKWSWLGREKLSLNLWLHQVLDVLWLLNGAAFIILLIVTGHWVRLVPTTWEVVPNALSSALQYASANWPTEHEWANYNSLQQLAYFSTIFVAAPIAALTGFRMSALWPKRIGMLNRWFPIEAARSIHFPTMIYFVLFIVVHVTLVFATSALRNLNRMYAGHDVVSWVGAGIFSLSVLVTVAAWFAIRPAIVAPLAGLFGKVGR